MEEKPKNPVEALIGVFKTPLAKSKGWYFDEYECSVWADELEEFLKHTKYEQH